MKTKIKKHRAPAPAGFTLIEVMVSVALTVILLLGVNFIFSTSSAAVRAGEALASASREQRGAQTQLFGDLNNIAKDAPFLISMRTRTQYLNADDALTSTSPDQLAIDNNGNFITINPVLYGKRSHRVDVLQFCAHEFYERRTSDNNSFYSYTFGDDVWVNIGHGNLPATDLSAYYGPDDVNAPSTIPPSILGAYASDWILNRTVMLFKAPSNVPMDPIASIQKDPVSGSYVYVPTPEIYYPQNVPASVALAGFTFQPYTANLTPLSWGNYSTDNSSQLGDSRFDLAGMTLEEFKQVCAAYVNNQTNTVNNIAQTTGARFPLWCAPWMFHKLVSSAPNTQIWDPVVTSPGTTATSTNAAVPPVWNWTHSSTGDGNRPLMNRFNINPTIQTQQTSASIAEMMPALIQHCSQFIVEYAGDYMTQKSDGTITSIGGDGTTDFYVDKQLQHHVRWYGLPRKTTQDATTGIRGYDPSSDSNTTMIANSYQDVIPLSDYITLVNGAPSNSSRALASFEVECNFNPCRDYAAVGSTTFVGNDYSNKDDSRYAVAWFNNTPTMIRVLIKVDDPNNALKDGPWYEYIFQLK